MECTDLSFQCVFKSVWHRQNVQRAQKKIQMTLEAEGVLTCVVDT